VRSLAYSCVLMRTLRRRRTARYATARTLRAGDRARNAATTEQKRPAKGSCELPFNLWNLFGYDAADRVKLVAVRCYRVARKNVTNFRMALCNTVGEMNQQKSMFVMSKHLRICL